MRRGLVEQRLGLAIGVVLGVALAVVGMAIALALHDGGEARKSERRATARSHRARVYTLRQGDVVLAPAAATRCEASQEGGFRNLFCTRVPEGRHQVIFYEDSVLVWPLARGPDSAPFAYRWEPKRRGK